MDGYRSRWRGQGMRLGRLRGIGGRITLLMAVVAAWALSPVIGKGPTVSAQQQPNAIAPESIKIFSVALKVEDLPNWFQFKDSAAVEKWISQSDGHAITAHAWELWAALTSPATQQLGGQVIPVFETWWNRDEIFAPPAQNKARTF